MLTATTGPEGRRPKAPVRASATMRATPIAARAAMNAPKMRSKVVSAMVRLPRRRSRPLWVSVCHDAAKRESSISAGLSLVAPKAPNQDSSTTVRRRVGRAGAELSETEVALIRARGSPVDGRGAAHRADRAATFSWRAVLRLLERRSMGVAAEDATASGQRLVAREMNAAMRAGGHLLGRLRRRR